MTSKIQKRRKRRQKRGREPLSQLHQALGELLTEMSRLERQMLIVQALYNEAPIEHLFAEVSGKPFAVRIQRFKDWCNVEDDFSEDLRVILRRIYQGLDELLPRRNYLVHGETLEGEFPGRGKKIYRIGIDKGNLEYHDEFDRGENPRTVFSVEDAREVTQSVRDIIADLQLMRE